MVFGYNPGTENIPAHLKYVSNEGLKNLENYQYKGSDNSFLGRLFLNDYWEWVVKQVPTWVAPNTLTFIGYLLSLLNLCTTLYLFPDLAGDAPTWYKYMTILTLFLYQTMDNIDGKQAKRIKSSSPLGELFDHCVDSCCTGHYYFAWIVITRMPIKFILPSLFGDFFSFYIAIWEQYHTGALIFGTLDSPTEVQFFVIFVIISSIMTSNVFWDSNINYWPNYSPATLLNIFFWMISGTFILKTIYGVYKLKSRNCSMMTSFSRLFPVLFFGFLSCLWISPILETDFASNPIPYLLTLCHVFAYLTGRFLTQKICKEKTRVFYICHLCLLVPALNSLFSSFLNIQFFDHLTLAYCALTLITIQLFVFYWSVIWQLCGHLNIRPFTPIMMTKSK